LGEGLARKGHEVTILHTITPLEPKYFLSSSSLAVSHDRHHQPQQHLISDERSYNGSVVEISPPSLNNLFAKYFDNPFAFQRETRHGKGVMRLKKMFDIMRDSCRDIYADEVFRGVVDQPGKFDLAIVQGILNDCVLGAVHKMGVPFMYLSPGPVFPSIQVSHRNWSSIQKVPIIFGNFVFHR
jgi:hypothetical protein